MSLTMIAMCWNQRSLLRESTGIGRPRGVRYSVSSIVSSPRRILTTRIRTDSPLSRTVDDLRSMAGPIFATKDDATAAEQPQE